MAGNTKQIFASLAVNVVIAISKGVAAFFTGSGAMLAETLHSTADCSNQLLLLLGVKQSAKPPDDSHPLGYGRDLYFWSFVVALLLFSGGGVFSIYEGVHKLSHPEPVENVGWGLGILLFSICMEGWATWGNLKEMKARRGNLSLLRYLELEPRRPYQTRHTAATLMLAAGENPEWIAQVMGHSTTAMLFKVYSRFVPNLTRQDGQAFAGLVHSRLAPDAAAPAPVVPESKIPEAAVAALRDLSPDQLAVLLSQLQTTGDAHGHV